MSRAAHTGSDRQHTAYRTQKAPTPDLPAGQCDGVLTGNGVGRDPQSLRELAGKAPCMHPMRRTGLHGMHACERYSLDLLSGNSNRREPPRFPPRSCLGEVSNSTTITIKHRHVSLLIMTGETVRRGELVSRGGHKGEASCQSHMAACAAIYGVNSRQVRAPAGDF